MSSLYCEACGEGVMTERALRCSVDTCKKVYDLSCLKIKEDSFLEFTSEQKRLWVCQNVFVRNQNALMPTHREAPIVLDPGVMLTTLPNGVRVASEPRAAPLASLAIIVEAGSRYETALNNGISHFIEHMAYKGFEDMNRLQLEESLLFMGTKMSSDTQREIQAFTAVCLPEFVPNVLDKLTRILTELQLDAYTLDLEKYNVSLEVLDLDLNPRAVTFDYLHKTAFQGTTLAQSVIGSTKNVRKFDQIFAKNFLREHYQPYKLCIVSSGPVDHSTMVSMTEARLGHLIPEWACLSDDGPCRFTGSQITYRDDSMPYAHVAIAFEAPGYGTPEYWPLYIATNMIGDWDRSRGGGLNCGSPLARAASCANLCESFEAFYIPYRDVGLWGIYWVGDSLMLDDMLSNVQDQWMQLCVMIQFTDVERGVANAKLALAREADGGARSCRDIGRELLYTCSRRSVADRWDTMSCTSVEQIRDCCSNILYDRCPAVAAVGPAEGLPDYTRIRAGQYWLRL